MSVIISDEVLQATQMSESEFKQEIAVILFQTGKLTLGHASKLAGMDKTLFKQLLKERKIPLYYYDVEDYEQDLKNLRELGDL
jgi:predicted HTH domain antitoxin